MIKTLGRENNTFFDIKPKAIEQSPLNGDQSITFIDSENRAIAQSIHPISHEIPPKSKTTKNSEMFSALTMENCKFSFKIWIFLRDYMIYHLFALSISGIFTSIEIEFGNSCVFLQINERKLNFEFFLAIFIEEIFIFGPHFLVLIAVVIVGKKYLHPTYTVIFFFALLFCHYLAFEGFIGHFFYLYFYIITIGYILFYHLILMIYLKCDLKLWFAKFFKGGSFLLVVLIMNLFICSYVLQKLFDFIEKHQKSHSKNIIKFILAIYSAFFLFLLKKLLFYNYESLLNENFNKKEISFRVLIFNRHCIAYSFALNLVGIIRMELDEWGAWFMVISYWLFLFESLTRINLKLIILEKLYFFIFKKKLPKTQKNENQLKFEKIFSGCFLDLVLISSCRLIIMYITNKWSASSSNASNEESYLGCDYTIEVNNFPLSLESILLVILINIGTISGIVVYMNFKKIPLILYKIAPYPFGNIYILTGLHFFEEQLFQLFVHVLFMKNGTVMN